MKKKLFLSTGILTIIALFLFFGFKTQAKETLLDRHSGNNTDVIRIDAMTQFGPLERADVLFPHDKHTDTLEKEDKDCLSCHKLIDNKLSYKFMRVEDTDKQSTTDVYHSECIGCHAKRFDEGKATGPAECGKCHEDNTDIPSYQNPMGMDKSLHYRHTKAYDKKCETCHHEYNEESKKLFYEKGKEGTCRYCHKEKTEENRISMELASHASCIECHLKQAEEKKEAGPIKCSGCHDLEKRKLIKKVESAPRIDRQQPDFVLMSTGDKELDRKDQPRMDFVPFNHKAHEASYDTCRACHHGSLSPCSKCHPLEGAKEGNNITLEQAIHNSDTQRSCHGCHAENKKDKNCSGCHDFLSLSSYKDTDSCLGCHVKPIPETEGKESAVIAETLLASKKMDKRGYEDKDIPEKFVIKELSEKYEAADFPHRKIVKKLTENIKDNKLAEHFHDEKGTLCRGCHHHGPVSEKPSRCGSCHGRTLAEKALMRPALKGAYHIQCMDCHMNMGINTIGCTDCHKEKANPF